MPSILEGVFSASDDELNKMLVSLVGMPKEQIEAELSTIKSRVEEVAQTIPTKGNKGDKGDKGDQGIQGPKGEPGRDGRDGFIGKDGKQGVDGKDGIDGKDGVSIVDVNVAFDNHLVITLSDGTEIDAGVIGGINDNLQNVVANYIGNSANGTLIYKGLWNASTNTPTLSTSNVDAGSYYVVSVAGSTNLSGITDWQVNDWAIFNGTAWQKIDNSDLFNPSAVAITGGSIDGTTIGSTTPSTGVFTTVGVQTSVNASGASSNINLDLISKGTGNVRLITNGTGAIDFYTNNSVLQSKITHTASAVNYVQVTGAATTGRPAISAQGSDTNIGLNYVAKGTGLHAFQTGNGTQFRINDSAAGSVNTLETTGSATGFATRLYAQGSDSNISFGLLSKGTGAIDLAAGSSGVNISNGGTVTALTRTGAGTGYTSPPTVAITAPTTAGGVQATASAFLQLATTPTITSGGTGYTVNDVLTFVGGTIGVGANASQVTVTSVSGGVITGISITTFGTGYSVVPTNPISVTGGTGTGATFTVSGWQIATFTITNAGSGYIEQPTVSFSGGGGSGASAYATVGSNTVQKTIGNIHTFATPNSSVLALVDKNSSGNNPTNTTVAFAMVPQQSAFGASYLGFGSQAYLGTTNSTSSAFIFATSVSSPVSNGGGGSTQLQIAHTASAVNYVQVTGGATGARPVISTQGSDANAGMNIQWKGQANMFFLSGSGSYTQFRILGTNNAVNNLAVTGTAAGSAPILSAEGSDTNIDIALTPKGTGLVSFGTYTAGAPAATGYISVKSAAGVTYKILVST